MGAETDERDLGEVSEDRDDDDNGGDWDVDGFIDDLPATEVPDQDDEIGNEDDGLPETDSDAETVEEEAAGEDSAGKGKPEPAPSADDIAARLEAMEKRFKDTQRSWHEEHQARLEAEKRLAERSKTAPPDAGPDSDPETEDDSYLTPGERARLRKIDELAAAIETLTKKQEERAKVEAWEAAAAPVRDEHDDFDAVVNEHFQEAWEKDPAIQQEFQEAGGTPEAAYTIGARIRDLAEITKDPESYKARLREELLKELGQPSNGNGNGKKHPTPQGVPRKPEQRLAGRTSRGPATVPKREPTSDEALDELLTDIYTVR